MSTPARTEHAFTPTHSSPGLGINPLNANIDAHNPVGSTLKTPATSAILAASSPNEPAKSNTIMGHIRQSLGDYLGSRSAQNSSQLGDALKLQKIKEETHEDDRIKISTDIQRIVTKNEGRHEKNLKNIVARENMLQLVSEVEASAKNSMEFEANITKAFQNGDNVSMLAKHQIQLTNQEKLVADTKKELEEAKMFANDFESMRTELQTLQASIDAHIKVFQDTIKTNKTMQDDMDKEKAHVLELVQANDLIQEVFMNEVEASIEVLTQISESQEGHATTMTSMKKRLSDEIIILQDKKDVHMGAKLKTFQDKCTADKVVGVGSKIK